MTKRSRREWPSPTFVEPPYVATVHRPGDMGASDPFRQFKQLARDDGKPYKSAEAKAERALLALLGTKGAVTVMVSLLVVVVVTVLALMIARA